MHALSELILFTTLAADHWQLYVFRGIQDAQKLKSFNYGVYILKSRFCTIRHCN